MNDETRRLWAQTRVFVWPQAYALVSLPLEALPLAASLIAASTDRYLKDHLLIRAEQADRAVQILQGLVNDSASSGVAAE